MFDWDMVTVWDLQNSWCNIDSWRQISRLLQHLAHWTFATEVFLLTAWLPPQSRGLYLSWEKIHYPVLCSSCGIPLWTSASWLEVWALQQLKVVNWASAIVSVLWREECLLCFAGLFWNLKDLLIWKFPQRLYLWFFSLLSPSDFKWR